MKKIMFAMPDGTVQVCVPTEGGRLALSVTLDGKTFEFKDRRAFPVDQLFRQWPVRGAVSEWAETEDEFAERIRRKDVPLEATHVQIVDGKDIPADRSTRDQWKMRNGSIEVPAKK